jgi:hypothetical protein
MRRGLRIAAVGLALPMAACEVRCTSADAEPAAAPAAAAPLEIPDGPASGRLHGGAFTVEDASLEEGVLELRQGQDFFPDRAVMIFLPLDGEEKEVVPEGRTWTIECDRHWRPGVAHVHAKWREAGEKLPTHDSITCGYRLRLELGEETPGKTLPGRIRLVAPELGVDLGGRFEATIEGFRLVDGEPDLGQDDVDTARVVARRWLAERAGAPVEITDSALAWVQLEPSRDGVQRGFGIYWWRLEGSGDTAAPQKLRFRKGDGVWQVDGALEPWRLEIVHRERPPDSLSSHLVRDAARDVEARHLREHGRSLVAAVVEGTGYNPKTGFGKAELRVYRGEDVKYGSRWVFGVEPKGEVARYLFRTDADYPAYNDPTSWRLERRLEPDEEIDFKEGRVRRRQTPGPAASASRPGAR